MPHLIRNQMESAFELSGNISAAFMDAGGVPILILDDFYANPDKAKTLALSLDYDLDISSRRYRNYPGERAIISFDINHIYRKVLKIYQEKGSNIAKFSRFIRRPVIFTKLNVDLIHRSHHRQRVPHIDDDCMMAGVIYLTDDDLIDGGTYFYKHRTTGISYLPPVPDPSIAAEMAKRGFSPLSMEGYLDFVKALMFEESAEISGTGLSESNDVWSVVGTVRYKFNRCVMFPARAFHSPVFSGARGGTRLTQNLFLTPA